MMKIILIPAHEVQEVFPQVKGMIGKALEYGHNEIALEDIYNHIVQGFKQLWIVADEKYKPLAAAVTEISNYPRKRVLRVLFLGGSGLDVWCELLEKSFVEFARKWQASAVEVIGRKGWIRELKKYGYDEWHAYIGKNL